MKMEGSGSISQKHGSADPDPDPDPHQNVMDPQHWFGEYVNNDCVSFSKKWSFQKAGVYLSARQERGANPRHRREGLRSDGIERDRKRERRPRDRRSAGNTKRQNGQR